MRLLLTCTLLVLTVQTNTSTQNGSNLEVLKFSWSKLKVAPDDVSIIQSVRAAENRTIPRKDEPDYVRNNRDLQERSAELRAGEADAARSARQSTDVYFYRMQVKNTGMMLVKSFIWEYQPSPNLRDSSPRQFLCTVKAKPNGTKGLEIFSPFAPSKVLDVAGADDNSPKKDKVVVNRIEYGDGTVWQRPGWDPSILSGATNQKVGSGKCVWL